MSFWQDKWSYKHSILIFGGLIINGFALEYFVNERGLVAPPFPYSLILLTPLIVSSVLTCRIKFFAPVKTWLISKPLNVTLITSIAVIAMISGYIPQQTSPQHPLLDQLGFFHLTRSIPFIILIVILIKTLMVATLNRLFPFRFKNIAFLINHLGILIVAIAVFFGSGDVKKVKINLEKDQTIWEGHLSNKPSIRYNPPFALKLQEFILEEFPPYLIIVDQQNKVIQRCGILEKRFLSKNLCTFNGQTIILNKYIPNAFKVKDKYVSVSHIGTSPMAEISIEDEHKKITNQGIVTRGSALQETKHLQINSSYKLAIPIAKPKSFTSKGTFYTPEKEIDSFKIAVNKPFTIKGWKLYQFGYNEEMGKWSSSSIIEAVKDPWLPIIYLGIFLMIFGSLFFMFPSPCFLENENE